MTATHLFSKYAAITSPLCLICGKKMEQSATPTSGGVAYVIFFLYSNDGGSLSWQPGHPPSRTLPQSHARTI